METKNNAVDAEQEFTPQEDGHLCCRNDGVKWKSNFESELVTKMKKLPPDEERCCQRDGKGWRCKNFRRSSGAPKSLCEKHYNYIAQAYQKKKTSGGSGSIQKTRGSKRRRKEEDDETTTQRLGATGSHDTSADTIIGGVTAANIIRRKRKNAERTKGFRELESLTRTWEPVVKSKSTLEHYKSKCFELSLELEKKKVELEKMKIDFTKLQGQLAEVIQNRKTAVTEETEEEMRWSCTEERPSQEHLQMMKNPFVNLVSDDESGERLVESEDSDCSDDTETSLGSLMDMLAMKYKNRNEHQDIEWKFEADMIYSLEADPKLNMKAVCALYRQHRTELEISTKGLFRYSDMLRATTLAKFLTDGACIGDLKKSVTDLEKFDSEGVEDCKRLARSYSKQLFSIYKNRKDPSSYDCLPWRPNC